VNDLQMETRTQRELVGAVVAHLNNGEISDAIAYFGDKFEFSDHGLRLQFTNHRRLSEFFKKTREFYPDLLMQTGRILVSLDHVTIEWTLRTTLIEPFYVGQSRVVPVELHGASIVRTENGRITEWTDYYDGLSARRSALGAYFEEWEL